MAAALKEFTPTDTALMLVDLQNDFIHPDGAYSRAKKTAPLISPLADRLAPLAQRTRDAGGWVVSTHFTLVPMKGGAPYIAPHLKALRPFLAKGDFAPSSWGQALFDTLAPADISVEKVAYSAFYMSRLEFALNHAGIRHLVFAGIVTNGGVASTLRDAHVRGFDVAVLEDGCGAFSDKAHHAALDDMASIALRTNIGAVMDWLDHS